MPVRLLQVVHLALRDELSSICSDVQCAFDLKADMDPGELADLTMKVSMVQCLQFVMSKAG